LVNNPLGKGERSVDIFHRKTEMTESLPCLNELPKNLMK
jgi:hypothetical protein